MNKTNMKKHSYMLSLIALAACITGCQEQADPDTIFVSSYPVYLLVKEIVKDKRQIVTVTPPGVEAHEYEISARKIAAIYDGMGLFINGLGMESWAKKLPDTAKKKTFDLSDGISPVCIEGKTDPHMWLNPLNAIKELTKIKDVLVTIDPVNSSDYLTNYGEAVARFTTLDEECEEIAKNLSNKYLCVSHAAFGYLCDRYGLTQISVNGLEPEMEPTTKTLEEIIQYVKEHGITTVFAEEIGSKDVAEKVAEETGCKLETLSTMEDGEENESYCDIYRENFEKIKEAGK